MDVLEDKKSKKELARKRSRRHLFIDEQLRMLRQLNEETLREAKEAAAPAQAPPTGDTAWMGRAAEIRNRLTDKKRGSAERWNRFAGTEGGGGRGL